MSTAQEYVAARRVLLDALDALEQHLPSLVLVGAQAVYHHAGAATLRVPVMTTDADLAVDTDRLGDDPEISAAMRGAGFAIGMNPGHWVAANAVGVDLMVVPHQSGVTGKSKRAARLPAHERQSARIARGLEPALFDNVEAQIAALEPNDRRIHTLRIAGPAALLTAKAIKLGERLTQGVSQPDRVKAKDALDAFRLLQAVDTADLVAGFQSHQFDEHAARVSAEALALYGEHCSTGGAFLTLASAAAQGERTVAPSFEFLIAELLDGLKDAGLPVGRTRNL